MFIREKCDYEECAMNVYGACDCPNRFDGRCHCSCVATSPEEETVKVNWSGGKDSTAAVLLRLKDGYKVKVVCYIPMLTDKIPLILKAHYNFIMETADLFRSMGAEVKIVSGMTYYEYVTHIAKKGKRKGQIFGFPCFKKGQCGFKRDSKLKALASCDVGDFDFEDIGIAFDEKDRFSSLTDKKRSTLVENEMTEKDAKEFDIANGVLSPHYDLLKRDGCCLCPHAPERERQMYFRDYPEAIPVVKELQMIVKANCPERTPLRGQKWFIEDDNDEQ